MQFHIKKAVTKLATRSNSENLKDKIKIDFSRKAPPGDIRASSSSPTTKNYGNSAVL